MKRFSRWKIALTVLVLISISCSFNLNSKAIPTPVGTSAPIIYTAPPPVTAVTLVIPENTQTDYPTQTPLSTYTPPSTFTPLPTYTFLPTPSNPTLTTQKKVSCRTLPLTSSKELTQIPKHKTVDILGINITYGLWFLVNWDGYLCWTNSQSVSVNGDLKVVPIVNVIFPGTQTPTLVIKVTNDSHFNLCHVLIKSLNDGSVSWFSVDKGQWKPGSTATLKFAAKSGFYRVAIYKCSGISPVSLVVNIPKIKLEDGGRYTVP